MLKKRERWSLSHFFVLFDVKLIREYENAKCKKSVILIKCFDTVSMAVYMLPVFVLQIYSSNKPQILSTAACNLIFHTYSFMHTNAGSLVDFVCFLFSFWTFHFCFCRSFYLFYWCYCCCLIMLFFAFKQTLGEKTKASLIAVFICGCKPCWSNYVQLCAIRCVQIILEQISCDYIPGIQLNWI